MRQFGWRQYRPHATRRLWQAPAGQVNSISFAADAWVADRTILFQAERMAAAAEFSDLSLLGLSCSWSGSLFILALKRLASVVQLWHLPQSARRSKRSAIKTAAFGTGLVENQDWPLFYSHSSAYMLCSHRLTWADERVAQRQNRYGGGAIGSIRLMKSPHEFAQNFRSIFGSGHHTRLDAKLFIEECGIGPVRCRVAVGSVSFLKHVAGCWRAAVGPDHTSKAIQWCPAKRPGTCSVFVTGTWFT
jgi:hypothetical protein